MLILNEVHKSSYSGRPWYQKMITMLIKEYFWPNMKNIVAKYIARCIECQQVKVDHQHLTGILQPLIIPNWKWEVICLDFIIRLLKNQKQNDSIIIVVDRISKGTHLYMLKQIIGMLTLLTSL